MQSKRLGLGLGACERVNRVPAARAIVVAVLAASGAGGWVQAAFAAGGTDTAGSDDSAAPPPAADGASPLKEIVITATRHEESQSKVPVSVSAFTQESMDLKGIKDFSDVARFTPGVTIDTNGTNSISIRGIASSGGAGTTGIYIDDTPIQMRALGFNPDDALPKAFDLDRVEVLRGPQGTLFGAGSEGGTVRYIMTQPSLYKSSLYARTEVSMTEKGRPSYEAGIAGGGPLIDDTLGLRASVWYRHDGGWIDLVDPNTQATLEKDANYSDTVVMRLAGLWAATPGISVTPSVLYQDRQTHNTTVYWPIYSDPSTNTYRDGDPDRRPEPDHYVLPSVKVEADLGRSTFISNTSFYARRDISGYPGTIYNLGYYQTFGWPASNPSLTYLNPSYYPLIDSNGIHLPAGVQDYRSPATVTNKQRNLAQEFRLQSNDPKSPWTWTAGMFWSVNHETSIEEISDPMLNQLFQALYGVYATDPSVFGEALLPNGDSYYNENHGTDWQLAGFGEATFAVTDRLKLTAGARYSKTKFSFTHFSDGPQNFGPFSGAGSQHETPFTPKLGATFQVDPNDMVYATYSKGFRIGGANAPIPVAPCAADFQALGIPGAPDAYNSDTVQSYEIGSKNNIGGQLRLASSLYYINWKGIQQNIYLPGCGFQFTTNLGTAVAKGFDLQADWAVTHALVLESAIGYTDARFSKDATLSPSAPAVALKGDAITGQSGVGAPPWTVTLGAQFNFLLDSRKSYFRVDYEYQSRNHWLTAAEDLNTSQYDPYAYTPSATSFVSLRGGTEVGGWSVSAFIDNLFDAHPDLPPSALNYPHSDIDTVAPPGQAASVLLRRYTYRPRTVGLTATYRM